MLMSDSTNAPDIVAHSATKIETRAAWVLGMVAALAVLFQAHISLPNGVVNLNLADPFAIFALAAVSLHLYQARQLPVWRIGQFNFALGGMSLVLVLGFVHGWFEIGITQWALGARLLGWVVLLGYLSAGYLIAANVGAHGLRRFSETLIATAAVIVMLQVILRLLAHWGVNLGVHLTPNFEGYAGNRNAFTFQLIVAMVLLLGYFQVYARYGRSMQCLRRPWIYSLLLGVLVAGVMWAGSRTGMLVGAAVFLYAWFSRPADRRMLCWGVFFAALVWCGVWLVAQETIMLATQFPSVFSGSSDQEHWKSLIHGFEMWRQSPILGAGLGVFLAKSPAWFGYPVVIHSTPLWILAEFGVSGGVVFGWAFVLLARHAIQGSGSQPAQRMLPLLLAAFAMFGVVHEMFYQRIFWLVLGVILAKPFTFGMHQREP